MEREFRGIINAVHIINIDNDNKRRKKGVVHLSHAGRDVHGVVHCVDDSVLSDFGCVTVCAHLRFYLCGNVLFVFVSFPFFVALVSLSVLIQYVIKCMCGKAEKKNRLNKYYEHALCFLFEQNIMHKTWKRKWTRPGLDLDQNYAKTEINLD